MKRKGKKTKREERRKKTDGLKNELDGEKKREELWVGRGVRGGVSRIENMINLGNKLGDKLGDKLRAGKRGIKGKNEKEKKLISQMNENFPLNQEEKLWLRVM